MRHREGGSLAPRTWSRESHWAFVLPCRRAAECHPGGPPPPGSSGEKMDLVVVVVPAPPPPPVAQANVAVVSARFQSGQRHCCARTVVSQLKVKVGREGALPGIDTRLTEEFCPRLSLNYASSTSNLRSRSPFRTRAKKVVSRFTQAITGRLTRDCGKSDFSTDRNNGLSCSSLAHSTQRGSNTLKTRIKR